MAVLVSGLSVPEVLLRRAETAVPRLFSEAVPLHSLGRAVRRTRSSSVRPIQGDPCSVAPTGGWQALLGHNPCWISPRSRPSEISTGPLSPGAPRRQWAPPVVAWAPALITLPHHSVLRSHLFMCRSWEAPLVRRGRLNPSVC